MEARHTRIKKLKCENQYTLVYTYHVRCTYVVVCHKNIVQNPNYQRTLHYYFFNSILIEICKYLLNLWLNN